jgi:hypothetical protein
VAVSFIAGGNPSTKTGRHDIADILLKVASNTINQIKSNQYRQVHYQLVS